MLSIGEIIKPNEFVSRVSDINFAKLKDLGYIALTIDLDHCLAPHNEDEVDDLIIKVLNQAQVEYGFKICIISNIVIKSTHREARLKNIADSLNAAYVAAYGFHIKPFKYSWIQAMDILKSKPENTVHVGDLWMMDIIGANYLGLYTIMVSKLGAEHPILYAPRLIENIIKPLLRPK